MSNISIVGSPDGPAVDERELDTHLDGKGYASAASKGLPNGLAGLDGSAKLLETNIPVRLGDAALNATYATRDGLWVNVKNFGVKGDNSTDDTASIVSAVAAAETASAFGAGLYFPPGNYAVTSAITISKSMTIRGAASQSTSIISKTGASGAFVLQADRIVVSDIYFQCQASIASVTTSQAVAIRYATGNLGVIERCYFAGWYMSIWFQSCGSWIVRDSYLSRAVLYNIKVQNTTLPDSGDQVVSGNYFAMGGSYATAAHIRQESAGGLRLVDNKVLQGAIGFDLATADDVATSILVAAGNSFEYQTTSAIRLGNAGPANTGTFQKILIAANQFTGNSCTSPVIDIIPPVAGVMWAIKVATNIMSGSAGATTFVHAKNVDDLSIDGNQMTTGAAGIVIDSTATNVYIGAANKTQGVTTPVSNATPSPVVNQMWNGLVITPPAGASAQSSMFVYTTAGAAAFTLSASSGNALFAGGVRVGGAYQNIASLYVTPTNTYPACVLRSGGGTADLLQLMDQSTTAIRFRLDQYGHIVADGMGAPSLAAQAGAGTSPTLTVTAGGSDTAGQINLTAGTSPAAGAQIVVTFANAYAASVRSVHLMPSSSAAAASNAYISAKSATGFTISVVNVPTAGASLTWFYQVIG